MFLDASRASEAVQVSFVTGELPLCLPVRDEFQV